MVSVLLRDRNNLNRKKNECIKIQYSTSTRTKIAFKSMITSAERKLTTQWFEIWNMLSVVQILLNENIREINFILENVQWNCSDLIQIYSISQQGDRNCADFHSRHKHTNIKNTYIYRCRERERATDWMHQMVIPCNPLFCSADSGSSSGSSGVDVAVAECEWWCWWWPSRVVPPRWMRNWSSPDAIRTCFVPNFNDLVCTTAAR